MFSQKFGSGMGGMTDGASGLVTGNDAGLGGFSGGSSTLGDVDLDWQDIINQAFAVGSQAISAFSGQHGGVQVGINPQGGIFAITPSNQTLYSSPYGGLTAQQIAALNEQRQFAGGGVAEDALGSLSSFVSQHPLMVFGAIAALFLLYREPPRRR